MADTTISVEQIIDDFGAYYQNQGQGAANLHMLPYESMDTQNAFTTVPTEDTILDEANVEVQEIVQQYQDDFTPSGGVEFEPVRIPLFKMKIDAEFNPHKLQRSWLGFLANNNTDVTTWPFIRWFIEMYLMKQSKEDLEMKAFYKGVYAAPTSGTAGDPSKVMDGVEKLLNDYIAAGALAPIVLGNINTLTDVQFVEKVELFVRSIPERYRYMVMDLNMNRSLREKYRRGVRAKYNMNYKQGDVSYDKVVDYDNITIAGRPSMASKTRIWCTPKPNALFGVKGFGNIDNFEIEKEKRKIAIYTEWHAGLGFIQPKMIFTSDGEVA
ncbi:hypothetical protein ACFOWM_03525 [Ferruginibacter yonginensis]|uniref:Uncharacterized protein n=1 Tax=Ferruginibacter yonginensis TaxID=1310416 RepID=A0ABV8QSC3_9BACT